MTHSNQFNIASLTKLKCMKHPAQEPSNLGKKVAAETFFTMNTKLLILSRTSRILGLNRSSTLFSCRRITAKQRKLGNTYNLKFLLWNPRISFTCMITILQKLQGIQMTRCRVQPQMKLSSFWSNISTMFMQNISQEKNFRALPHSEKGLPAKLDVVTVNYVVQKRWRCSAHTAAVVACHYRFSCASKGSLRHTFSAAREFFCSLWRAVLTCQCRQMRE